MSTNYVISCWSGMRRVNPERYVNDRSVFIETHINSLFKYENAVDHITIVINDNPEEPKEFRNYINSLPSKLNGKTIEIIRRPNVGYSYGCYSDVFAKYRLQFDNYILMEDDYCYAIDNFDRIMFDKAYANKKVGFVSFWNAKGTRSEMLARTKEMKNKDKMIKAINKYFPDKFVFPRVAVGFVKAKMLEDIFTAYGTLPYATSTNHGECKIEGQFGLSVAGQKFGWTVHDLVPEYGVVAFGPLGEVMTHNPDNKKIFITAIQSLL